MRSSLSLVNSREPKRHLMFVVPNVFAVTSFSPVVDVHGSETLPLARIARTSSRLLFQLLVEPVELTEPMGLYV